MGNQLYNVYLDNEAWICDPDAKTFTGLVDRGRTLTFAEAEAKGLHLATLLIVTVKGYPYYYDERLKEMRRVGEPSFVLTFDQYDLIPERNRKMTVPTGEAFKRVMAKEKAFWQRSRSRESEMARVGG